jgi:hypothetical protein
LEFEPKNKTTSTTNYIKLEDGGGARRGELDGFVQQRGRHHGG